MQLTIVEIHSAGKNGPLNEEWFVVENQTDKSFSTNGCAIGVTRGSGRPRTLGTLDPGFTLQPGEKKRVITGNPGKKAHGKPPAEDDIKNYHLFQADLLLSGPGSVLSLSLRQHEVARGAYDPAGKRGVAAAATD